MPNNYPFRSPSGGNVLDKIVEKLVPQWPTGLKPFQRESILRILDQQQLLCITATGDGKSALFAIPILVHLEIGRNKDAYPRMSVPVRQKPVGIVVTPTKGLANNIVRELEQFKISGFAYTHDNIASAVRQGRRIVDEITECKFQIVCVDPEHLCEPEWWKILNSSKFRSNIVFGCAEECHLIDEWGLTFRPAFRNIGTVLTGRLPSSAARFAITATLQPGPPTESICTSLGFRGASFHLTRRSNARPNTKIILHTLTSPMNGSSFPQLLLYLNDRRKTIIHAETILLGYHIFLYLLSCLPAHENALERIQMYNSLAPDGYNEETVELINDDPRMQIVIATQAFTNGMHANKLVDSICVKTAKTQDGSEQQGDRVCRKENTVGRRIILATPTELKQAKNIAHGFPDDMDLASGFPRKAKQSDMDPAKAYFLTETICRMACINRIYQNPPFETSFIDCIAAVRPQPCDLCCMCYHVPDDPRPVLQSANPDLSSFSHSPPPGRAKTSRGLSKKHIESLNTALTAFDNTLWLEERSNIPHRNFPRSAYFPKSLIKTIISKFSTLKSYKDLEMILLSASWRFRESQGRKLFGVLSTFKKTVSRSRKRKHQLKAKESSDSEDLMDVDDRVESAASLQGSSQMPTGRKRAAVEAGLDEDVERLITGEESVVQSKPNRACRAKRKPAASAAETSAAYKPAYRTDARSRRVRRGAEDEID